MMKDYKPAGWEEKIEKELVFDDGHDNGYVFHIEDDGELVLNDYNRPSYEYCLAHPEKFARYNQIVKRKRIYKEYASGICDCGKRIELYNQYLGACECPYCGRWYSLFGQNLKNPDEWDERIN